MIDYIENELHWNAVLSPFFSVALAVLSLVYLVYVHRKGCEFKGGKMHLWDKVFSIVFITVMFNLAVTVYYTFFQNLYVITAAFNLLVLYVEYEAFNSFNRILRLISINPR